MDLHLQIQCYMSLCISLTDITYNTVLNVTGILLTDITYRYSAACHCVYHCIVNSTKTKKTLFNGEQPLQCTSYMLQPLSGPLSRTII
jgi:uncharacterized protein YebE (UPF0316 family)